MPLAKAKVLSVQHDESTLSLCSQLLDGAGAQLRIVASSSFLLDEAYEWRPDLVLLNCADGVERTIAICEAMRRSDVLADVPLVVLTATECRQTRIELLRAGADECLFKPFDVEEFQLRVEQILGRQAHRKRLAEKELFTMLSQRLPYGVLLVDKEDKVVFTNVSAQMSFFIHSGSTHSWVDMLDAHFILSDRQRWYSLRHDTLAPQELLMRSSPDTGWYKCMVFPLQDDPQERRMVCIVDVTASIDIQDVVLGIKRLIMHKIRTPVNGLLGPLDMLREDPHMDADDRASIIGILTQSANRLTEAIESIEDYCYSPVCRPAVQPLAAAELEGLAMLCAKEQLLERISLSSDLRSSLFLPLDARQCQMVFSELVGNSIKFHPRHSPELKIDIRQIDGAIDVVVEDDGGSVDPAIIGRLPMPFCQAERMLCGENSGMGLGLAQVARLIYSVNGHLSISNRCDGPGVCVRMRIPVIVAENSKFSSKRGKLVHNNC